MKKILALILTLALTLSMVCAGFVAEATVEPTNSEYYWEPVDAIGYDEAQIDIRGTNADVALTAEEKEASKPRLVTGGVNGSNAMQVGGSYTYSRYLMHFRINGLKLDTTYVIEMDVKKVSGAIRTMQAGVWRAGAYNYSTTTYADADISSDAFTTLTFESSLSGSYIPHYLIVNFNTTSAGAVLLIDNIVVYEKEDSSKTNLYDTSLAVETGSENPGTFDKEYKLWFDNEAEENLCYFPVDSIPYRTSGTANVVPVLSNMGEGVKGSYAMKLETAASKQSTLYMQPAATSTYSASTEYVIEMKIKKSAGSIASSNLLIGMNENNAWNWSKTITDAELSSEYTYFKWSHTTSATTGWRHFCFRYTAGSSGATLLIDEIKIYKASDANKTPIVFQNGLEADCDFDLDDTYYGIPTDDTADTGIDYSPAASVGDKVSGSNASDYPADIAPAIVAGGVKGSYAMKIGGATQTAISNYTVTFAGQKFVADTDYTIEVDIKKLSGTVGTLSMGLTTSTGTLVLDDERLCDSFTTYKWNIKTKSTINASTWMYLQFILNTDVGGAELLIDNIKVYASEEIEKPNFATSNNGVYTFDVSSQMLPVYKENAAENEYPLFKFSSNNAYPVNGAETSNVAELVCLENADSGSYAMAIGAANDDPTKATVRFGLRELDFGKTYKVKFSAFIVNSFNLFNASITATNGGSDVYEIQISKNTAEKDIPRSWQEFEFTYTNTSTLQDYVSHAYLIFSFEDNNGAGAVFVDSISVCEIDESGAEVGPNIFINGDFEYFTEEEPDWTNSEFWSNDSATDFSFMQNIEKELGGLGTGIVNDSELFSQLITSDTYEAFDSYIVASEKFAVAEYEAIALAEAGKKVWLCVNQLIDNNKTLATDWQAKLIRYATMMQNVCGDNFQGFYFDEPAYYCTSDEFTQVTKFCREYFRKRVFAIHFNATFTNEETTEEIKFIADAANHAYVTDVGYWRYGSWDAGSDATMDTWNDFVSTLNENTRIWVTPLLGRHDYLQTEDDIVGIINGMLSGCKDLDNFGGVMFYSMSYQPATIELDDEKYNQAVNEGAVKTEVYTVIDASGEVLYNRYFRGGGAYLINPESEEYMPNVAALVNQIAKEFKADTAFRLNNKCGTYDIVNNVIYVTADNVTVSDIINASGLADIANTFVSAGEPISADMVIGTDYTLTSEFITCNFSYSIAVKNDANGDGLVNIIDLVRAVKLAKFVVEGTDAQYVALNSSNGEVSAEALTILKRIIFNS